MKKYEEKTNVTGELIRKIRLKKKLSANAVCEKLQLHAVYIDRIQLYRMETGKMIIKDFELVALCKVLEIDYDELKNSIM